MAEQKEKCPLCGKDPVGYGRDIPRSIRRFECKTCGNYDITDQAFYWLERGQRKDDLHLLSSVTRQTHERGECFQITKDVICDDNSFDAQIRSIAPRGVVEKSNFLLQYLAKEAEYQPSKVTVIEPLWDFPIAFCKDRGELDFYISHLADSGLVEDLQRTARSYGLKITFKGWEKIEQMARPNLESKQAFVAMWFSDEVEDAFIKGIIPLEEDTGFSMMRVDMQEYNDKICDRIIAEIKKSRFLIVDVTGHRHAVYFEAGYAMGMGLPVIWTCREDYKPSCHQIFNTRQYNHIFWNTPEELREKLRDRILATIGKV